MEKNLPPLQLLIRAYVFFEGRQGKGNYLALVELTPAYLEDIKDRILRCKALFKETSYSVPDFSSFFCIEKNLPIVFYKTDIDRIIDLFWEKNYIPVDATMMEFLLEKPIKGIQQIKMRLNQENIYFQGIAIQKDGKEKKYISFSIDYEDFFLLTNQSFKENH